MTTTWRRVPLRDQLALVVGLVIVSLLLTFSSLLYVGLRVYLLNQRQQQLQTAALTTINLVVGSPSTSTRNWSPTPPGPDLIAKFHELVDSQTEPNISAVVFGHDATVLARGPRGSPAPPRPGPRVIERVVDRNHPVRYLAGAINNRQMAVLVPLFDEHGAIIAVMQVASSIKTTDDLLKRLLTYLLEGTALCVVAGMALSALLTTQLLRPLHRIVKASAAVAHGDYTTRVKLPPGNEIGQVGEAFDEMVAQTAESFARQQRFVADAAHELRTPLTAIGGSIEMLQMGAVDGQPEKRRHMLQSVSNEVDRLGRLVNDLLLLSNLDGQSVVRRTALDLRPILLDLIDQTSIAAPYHHFVADLPTPLPVKGNADQLRQVFLNLLTNAHKYTATGGTISVSGRHMDQVVVDVVDSGIGIPREELPHIWDRLYRVDRSRSRANGGFGLGLAIVQTIVAAHGGTVEATSVAGRGTTFSVRLPPCIGTPGNL